MYPRVLLAGNRSKQHGGHRGGNFGASKFISSFSLKAKTTEKLFKLFVKILSISVAVLEVNLVGRVINGQNILEYIISKNSPVDS